MAGRKTMSKKNKETKIIFLAVALLFIGFLLIPVIRLLAAIMA